MTIKFMEGFETAYAQPDLANMGFGITGVPTAKVAARYANGTALGRANYTGANYIMNALIGMVGTGTGACFAARRRNDLGVTNGTAVIRRLNGRWFLVTNNQSIYTTSSADPVDWELVPNTPAIATTLRFIDMVYDATRSDYIFVAASNTTSNASPIYYTTANPMGGVWSAAQSFTGGGSLSSTNAQPHTLYTDGTIVLFGGANRSAIWKRQSDGTFLAVNGSGSTATPVTSIVKLNTSYIAYTTSATVVYVSTDNGDTWTQTTATNAPTNYWSALRGIGGTKVFYYISPTLYESADGINFTANTTLPAGAGTASIVRSNTHIILVPQTNGTPASLQRSVDGVTWETVNTPERVGTTMTALNGIGGMQYNSGYIIFSTFGAGVFMRPGTYEWVYGEDGSGSNITTNGVVGLGIPEPDGSIGEYGFNILTGGAMRARYAATSAAIDYNYTLGTWLNCGVVLAKTNNQWGVTYTINDATVYTQPIVESPRYYIGTNSGGGTMFTMNGRVGYNGTRAIGKTGNSNTTAVESLDGGRTWTEITTGQTFIPTAFYWTGTRFVGFNNTANFIYSTTGEANTWLSGTVTGSGAVTDLKRNGTTVIITRDGSLPAISRDGGVTWAEIAIASNNYRGVAYSNSTWVLVSGTSGAQSAYSTDNGTTWIPVTLANSGVSVYGVSVFKGKLYYVVSNGVQRASVPSGGGAPIDEAFTVVGTFTTATVMIVGTTNALVITHGNSTVFYSYDGMAWMSATTPSSSIWPSRVGESIFIAGNTASPVVYYPDIASWPIFFRFVAAGISAVDDIVITDFTAPNAGPIGDARIVKLVNDTDVQAQWGRVPANAPTNAAAATVVPRSKSSGSYVEGKTPGDKDIYKVAANTADVVPAGFRPVAVSVEANFSRVFTNTPVVNVGLGSGAAETKSDNVPITTGLTSNTFIKKVVEQDPNGNKDWTKAALSDLSLSITKVS